MSTKDRDHGSDHNADPMLDQTRGTRTGGLLAWDQIPVPERDPGSPTGYRDVYQRRQGFRACVRPSPGVRKWLPDQTTAEAAAITRVVWYRDNGIVPPAPNPHLAKQRAGRKAAVAAPPIDKVEAQKAVILLREELRIKRMEAEAELRLRTATERAQAAHERRLERVQIEAEIKLRAAAERAQAAKERRMERVQEQHAVKSERRHLEIYRDIRLVPQQMVDAVERARQAARTLPSRRWGPAVNPSFIQVCAAQCSLYIYWWGYHLGLPVAVEFGNTNNVTVAEENDLCVPIDMFFAGQPPYSYTFQGPKHATPHPHEEQAAATNDFFDFLTRIGPPRYVPLDALPFSEDDAVLRPIADRLRSAELATAAIR